MFLFIVLSIIAFILITFVIGGIILGGSVFIIIFSDVIVCTFIILFIAKKIIKK